MMREAHDCCFVPDSDISLAYALQVFENKFVIPPLENQLYNFRKECCDFLAFSLGSIDKLVKLNREQWHSLACKIHNLGEMFDGLMVLESDADIQTSKVKYTFEACEIACNANGLIASICEELDKVTNSNENDEVDVPAERVNEVL